jgi:hypothetical protein
VHIDFNQSGTMMALDSVAGHGPGSRTTASHPPQVQGLIKKLSVVAGRSGRGRIYIADMQEDQVSDAGAVDSSGLAKLQAIADAIMSMAGIGSWGDPVILHTAAGAPIDITAMQPEGKVATQRRRFRR